MKSQFLIADSSGNIPRAGEGCGFALLPGRAAGARTVRPGSFPVAVITKSGKRIEVTGPHAYYLAEEERRAGFKIECGSDAAGESWNVVTFDDPTEGVRSGAARPRLTTRVQSATAAPTIVPVGAVGFKVRPGTQTWTVFAGGTLQVARIWVQDLDGTWIDTLEDVDFTVTPVVTRLVDATGRVYLRSAAATLTLAIDVTEEVG